MAILQTKNLKKTYPNGVEAVRGIDLKVPEGCCFGLLGPNGAGKTTTIEMLEGILHPSEGEIFFRGQPLKRDFSQRIGIQFQHTSLPDYLRVNEVIDLFYSLYKKTRPLEELIEVCALSEFYYRDAKKLSGGQRQRVLLAIAMINDPELIFLDEPTTGLDPQARRNFWDLIENIKKEKKTIILTTHYMDEAELLCDELVIVDKGQIIEHDTPKALIQKLFKKVEIRLPAMEELPLEYTVVDGQFRIATNSPEQTISDLLNHKTDLSQMVIHQFNLEDVFIHLTGRSLRE